MTAITDKCVSLIDADEWNNTFTNFCNMGDLKKQNKFFWQLFWQVVMKQGNLEIRRQIQKGSVVLNVN
jgi:hypothetical protein